MSWKDSKLQVMCQKLENEYSFNQFILKNQFPIYLRYWITNKKEKLNICIGNDNNI